MHIRKVTIKNFRRAGNLPLEVNFKHGTNILIGENNIGKTTIVEAIALVLGYGSIDRSPIQLKPSDFNDRNLPIEIDIDFSGLSDEQEASFIEALDLSGDQSLLSFQFRFHLKDTKILPDISCGQHGSTHNPYELLAHLNCHYLRALRDVSQEFRPGARNRVGKMLNKLFKEIEGDEQEQFLDIFRTAEKKAINFVSKISEENEDQDNQAEDSDKLSVEKQPKNEEKVGPIKKLEVDSNKLINKLQFIGDDNSIVLSLHERELIDILHTVFPKSSVNQLDLALNGLGYNNLIYVAILLTEIKVLIEPHEFICLIIEEPEAHLHPQLQRLLLEFLRTEYEDIQVVISSHSPNFIADSDIDDLILITTSENKIPKGISLASVGLGDTKYFLRKFLDVTKSQLFFSRKIVFVEGYTEALLFRAFWDNYYPDEISKFYKASIEVVNIGNIAFKHYVDLVAKVFKCTGTLSVILTDDDRGTGRDVEDIKKIIPKKDVDTLFTAWSEAKPSARYNKLKKEIDELKKKGCKIEVFSARRTFEIEFALTNIDKKIVKSKIASNTYDSEDATETKVDKTNNDLKTALSLWKAVNKEKVDYALEILAALEKSDVSERPRPPRHFIQAFKYLNGN